MRDDGVRTVVWVTPWVNLDSADGQRPPDAESERMHREPAPNYAEGAARRPLRPRRGRRAPRRPLVDGDRLGRSTSPREAARGWWRELARPVFELGVEGVKADDGEGYYFPPDARFADGRTGAEAAWEYGALYRRDDAARRSRRSTRAPASSSAARAGAASRRPGSLWGGDQASDFWSLRALLASLLTAAASGFSNLSHDVGGYLGQPPLRALRARAARPLGPARRASPR